MNTDTTWYVWVMVIAIEILFLYALTKYYGRKIDEQEEKELSKLKEYDNYNS